MLFLSEHFRCHDGIIEFCNALLYKGMLVPSRPLGGYKLAGITPSPFLFREVAVASWIVDNYDFFDAIYNADGANPGGVIGVVTPFSAQASLITRKLRELGGAELASRITSGTAHGLQGAERPVVLFSAVGAAATTRGPR